VTIQTQDTQAARDAELLSALRNGVEQAFTTLVERYHERLVQSATKYVRDPAAGADVAQETWIGFLQSLDRFEERCSIKTWLFRILFNKAQAYAKRDRRVIPFSALASDEASSTWNSIDPDRFKGVNDALDPGHWTSQPPPWKTSPQEIFERKEALETVHDAIEKLPPAQGTVMILRDLNGLSSKEVCNVLGISATNQRVLLHRARTRVRRALSERYGDGI